MEKCGNIVSNHENISTIKPADVLIRSAAETQSPGSSAVLVAHYDGQIVKGEDPSEIIEGYKIDLDDGDVIIIATNGLFDNLYEQEIASIISKSLQAGLSPQGSLGVDCH